MKTALFDFDLPQEFIATEPVSPRDASRMLVVGEGGRLSDDFTRNLAEYLKPGDVMVFNDTKVIPARLHGTRGEARVEVTLLRNHGGNLWSAYARKCKRLHVGDKILFGEGFSAEICKKHEGGVIELSFASSDIYRDLHKFGEMPLPPYMKRHAQESDKHSYQTVYAQREGAVAAPTAGLHFTPEFLKNIDKLGVKRVQVTLHVGAGTFQPVKAEDTAGHVMHSEYAEITGANAEIINQARERGGRVVAVGTTSLRVLESAANDRGQICAYSGDTDIFITPGYKFKAVDVLLTNFHLPRSTLFMLVSAFKGLDVMKAAYEHAKASHYRFYSYGDACLLIR